MPEATSPVLAAWSNFYVIAGSSAGALTGLMFVTITLVAGRRESSRQEGTATYSTPTVVHFCVSLFVSALLSAPWHTLVPAAVLLLITGLFGIGYVARIIHRQRRQTIYQPQVDDWIWYGVLPLVAYVTITAGAIMLALAPTAASFALAGATLLLLFIGIHNAWDIVTFIALQFNGDEPEKTPKDADASAPRP